MSLMSRYGSKRLTNLCVLIALSACSNDSTDNAQEEVELRYTEYGVAHSRTADYQSLGVGQGYAQARDNLCKIELGMLGFDGRISRLF